MGKSSRIRRLLCALIAGCVCPMQGIAQADEVIPDAAYESRGYEPLSLIAEFSGEDVALILAAWEYLSEAEADTLNLDFSEYRFSLYRNEERSLVTIAPTALEIEGRRLIRSGGGWVRFEGRDIVEAGLS